MIITINNDFKANGVAVFANNDVDCTAMHGRITVDLIDAAIRNIDGDHNRLTAYIVEIGKCHRNLRQQGLGIGMWDEFGDSLIDCLRRYDSVRKHKELRRAWLALIAYIIDNLKQGQSLQRSGSSYDLSTDRGSPSSQKRV
uniref:GLOBIN domain-containing protein n=1 Tax=Heterorhabditis bacteriophora TaxID=37862 RepID=A0A1I7X3J8_HETBA